MGTNKPKKSKYRSLGSYRAAAREIGKLVPSVAKFAIGKQKLTGAQKGQIAKAEKAVRNKDIIPLSKEQAAKVGKHRLFGHGVRGIAGGGFGDGTRVRIKKDGTVEFRGKSGRRVISVPLPTPLSDDNEDDIDAYDGDGREQVSNLDIWLDAIDEIVAKHDGSDITFWLWTARGRTDESYTARTLAEKLYEIASGGIYSHLEEWLFGLMYLVTR